MVDSPDKVESPVDLEAMISKFVREDSSGEKLELPSTLTAEQRKEAKKIVDQHSDLSCESYGFGAERRLCIFKKLPQDRVRVKNTFIDGFGDEAPEGADGPLFRTMPTPMPVNLLERTLQRAGLGVSGGIGTPDGKLGRAANDGDARVDTLIDASPASTSTDTVELPPLPEGFQVRNTFIHIEEMPAVERIVQSMPKGMFRQCLESELSVQQPGVGAGYAGAGPAAASGASGYAAPAVPAAVAPTLGSVGLPEQGGIVPGMEVFIQGLVKLPDFNGLKGVVQTFDPETGRYDVLLDGAAGVSGWRWVKVKGENCRPCIPPPPVKAPTLYLDGEAPVSAGGPEASNDSTQIPATPKWEEAGCDGKGSTPLKLNALV